MIEDFVYKLLEKYGNCVISIEDVKKYGKKKILKELEKNGYKCNIRIYGEDKYTGVYPHLKYNEQTCIVEVKK